MIVRTAAHYRSPPDATVVPLQPVAGQIDPAPRVRDYILVHGIKAALAELETVAPRITIADVQAATCAHYGLKPIDMTTDCRSVRIARPRQIAMALARELTPRSLSDIGVRFGNRDHTTVLHAIRAVARRVETDAEVRADRDAIAAAATLIDADRRREFAND